MSLATRGGRDAPRVRRDQCTKLDAHIGGRYPPSPPCFFNGGGRVGEASRKIYYRYEIRQPTAPKCLRNYFTRIFFCCNKLFLSIFHLLNFPLAQIPTCSNSHLLNFPLAQLPTLLNFQLAQLPTLLNFPPCSTSILLNFPLAQLPTLLNFHLLNIPEPNVEHVKEFETAQLEFI